MLWRMRWWLRDRLPLVRQSTMERRLADERFRHREELRHANDQARLAAGEFIRAASQIKVSSEGFALSVQFAIPFIELREVMLTDAARRSQFLIHAAAANVSKVIMSAMHLEPPPPYRRPTLQFSSVEPLAIVAHQLVNVLNEHNVFHSTALPLSHEAYGELVALLREAQRGLVEQNTRLREIHEALRPYTRKYREHSGGAFVVCQVCDHEWHGGGHSNPTIGENHAPGCLGGELDF